MDLIYNFLHFSVITCMPSLTDASQDCGYGYVCEGWNYCCGSVLDNQFPVCCAPWFARWFFWVSIALSCLACFGCYEFYKLAKCAWKAKKYKPITNL